MEIKTFIGTNPKGSLVMRYEYYLNADGKEIKHGLYELWHSNGKKETEIQWERGKKHGAYISWRDDGTVSSIGEYNQNELNGVCKSWFNGSQLASEELVENGKTVNGKFYSRSGEIISTIEQGSGKEI